MREKSVDIAVSENLVPYLHTLKDGTTVSDKLTLSAVIGLHAAKIITLEKAAELMGKSIWDFMDILKKYQIPWGEYTEESSQLDDIALEKLTGGFYG